MSVLRSFATITILLAASPAPAQPSTTIHTGPAAIAQYNGEHIFGSVFVMDSMQSGPFACATLHVATGREHGCGPAAVTIDTGLETATASGTIPTVWRSEQGHETSSAITFDIAWTEDFPVILPGAFASLGLSPVLYVAASRPAAAASETLESERLGAIGIPADGGQLQHAVWLEADTGL